MPDDVLEVYRTRPRVKTTVNKYGGWTLDRCCYSNYIDINMAFGINKRLSKSLSVDLDLYYKRLYNQLHPVVAMVVDS